MRERRGTSTLNPIKRYRDRCREIRGHMSDFVDGELDQRAVGQVKRHVWWCPNCRRMLASLTRTISGLHALRNQPTPTGERPHI